MDINSLLSPQDSPASDTPPPRQSASPRASPNRRPVRPAAQQRKPSSLSQQVPRSPLAKDGQLPPLASRPSQHELRSVPQHSVTSAPFQNATYATSSTILSPYTSGLEQRTIPAQPPISRHSSTPGMDTLADLASMQQHHHSNHRQHNPSRASGDMQDSRGSEPSQGHNGTQLDLRNLHRSLSARSAADVIMSDPPLKECISASLSTEECATLKQLSEHLSKQPSDLASHVAFINLLHKGFVQHSESQAQPANYELLAELRSAREVMDRLVPVGEALWRDWLMDERSLAPDLNSSMQLLNLHQRAITDEPASTALWRLYGDYGYYIWSKAVSAEPQTVMPWSEEEKRAAREMLPWSQMISIWENGVAATRYSINDSNIIWDRYMEILLDNLEENLPEARRNDLYLKFQDRLLNYPHKTWEETFQMFSRFVSSHYDSSEYEKIMPDISKKSKQIKEIYDHRLQSESRISLAKSSGDENSERQAYMDYLAWELSNKGVFSFPYINGLYRRATTRFWNDAFLWTAYVEYLIQHSRDEVLIAEVLERATRHCPWSGDLWSHSLLNMEAGGKSYNDVSDLKHKATASGFLELGGLEELLKLHTAWCGYLRRKAFEPGATEEELDVAHVGIRAALEHVQEFGYKTQGKSWAGDPQYRLERIEIKFLTGRGDVEAARESWKALIKSQHNSYDFWYRYYIWEMVVWAKFAIRDRRDPETQLLPPTPATSVLQKALEYYSTMDSPETLLSMYLNHCEQHETIQTVRKAIIDCRELQNLISKRRTREYHATAVTQQQPGEAIAVDVAHEQGSAAPKRKRERESEAGVDTEHQLNKKQKEEPKRDREHAVILIKDFPDKHAGVGRIRKFLEKFGGVNDVKKAVNGEKVDVLVEFESKTNADYAKMQKIRWEDKYPLKLEPYEKSTLWCTNYPPSADEGYIRRLFKGCGEILSVRFPSLQGNVRRRFCYVQFLRPQDALQAQAELNGKVIEGEYRLTAVISDPDQKEERHGAQQEGREVFVRNLDVYSTADDVKDFFQQCGAVEWVRWPKTMDGKNKTFAFVVFKESDAAQNAVSQLNGAKFPARRLEVSMSNPKVLSAMTSRSKHAENLRSKSPSLGPGAGPDSTTDDKHRAAPKRERQVGLAGIPDTVNTARVEKLAEKYGALVKVTLHHDRGCAVIEFVEASSIGRLEMDADKLEFDGQKVELTPVEELENVRSTFKRSTHKDKTIITKAKPAATNHKAGTDNKFGRPKNRLGGGSRFGLGFKKSESTNAANGEAEKGPKSNADFRAMIRGSSSKAATKDLKSSELKPTAVIDGMPAPETGPIGDVGDDESHEANSAKQKHSADEEMAEAPEDIPLDDLLA